MLIMIGPPDGGYDSFETLFQSIVLWREMAIDIGNEYTQDYRNSRAIRNAADAAKPPISIV